MTAVAVRRLNHAVLYVSDLSRSVDFYRATLGFELRTEIAFPAISEIGRAHV